MRFPLCYVDEYICGHQAGFFVEKCSRLNDAIQDRLEMKLRRSEARLFLCIWVVKCVEIYFVLIWVWGIGE